jgi:iron complex outermembrane receptor protein
MIRILARLALAAAIGAPLLALHATAATTDASATTGLEEIVVTATRREERLQDVPVSVSAFSQEKLDAEGLKNIDDDFHAARGAAALAGNRAGIENP